MITDNSRLDDSLSHNSGVTQSMRSWDKQVSLHNPQDYVKSHRMVHSLRLARLSADSYGEGAFSMVDVMKLEEILANDSYMKNGISLFEIDGKLTLVTRSLPFARSIMEYRVNSEQANKVVRFLRGSVKEVKDGVLPVVTLGYDDHGFFVTDCVKISGRQAVVPWVFYVQIVDVLLTQLLKRNVMVHFRTAEGKAVKRTLTLCTQQVLTEYGTDSFERVYQYMMSGLLTHGSLGVIPAYEPRENGVRHNIPVLSITKIIPL